MAGAGDELREASEVTVVDSNEGLADGQAYMLRSTNNHSQTKRDVDRQQKVQTTLDDSTLQHPTKSKLLTLLQDNHDAST